MKILPYPLETLILTQLEGGFPLDDVCYIQEDETLQTVFNLDQMLHNPLPIAKNIHWAISR